MIIIKYIHMFHLVLHTIPVVSSPSFLTLGFLGLYFLHKAFENTQECLNDDDCLYYPKCCLDHCCDYDEYNTRIIPIYVYNK